VKRIRIGLVVATGVVVLSPSTACAHQPLYLGLTDATLAEAPTVTDGRVSVAAYATLHGGDDTRSMKASLRSGDRLTVELLIPALEPERSLAAADLPWLEIIAPDGSTSRLQSAFGEQFDEQFTGTSYVRLTSLNDVAVDGTYGLMVHGIVPARVTLVTGYEERSVEITDSETKGSVAEWYATPPSSALDTSEPAAVTQPQSTVAVVTTAGTSSTTAPPPTTPVATLPTTPTAPTTRPAVVEDLAPQRHVGRIIATLVLVGLMGTVSFLVGRRWRR
jgi:hypothetical protein